MTSDYCVQMYSFKFLLPIFLSVSCVDLAEKLAGFQIFFPHRKENKINPVNDDQLVKEEKIRFLG